MKRNENNKKHFIEDSLDFDLNLTDSEFRLLSILIGRENRLMKQNESFFSYEGWLADKMGKTKRTVINVLNSLKNKGYIIVNKGSRNGHSVNFYQINWNKINNLVSEETESQKETKVEDNKEICEIEARDLHISENKVDKDMYENELKEVAPLQMEEAPVEIKEEVVVPQIEETTTNVVEETKPVVEPENDEQPKQEIKKEIVDVDKPFGSLKYTDKALWDKLMGFVYYIDDESNEQKKRTLDGVSREISKIYEESQNFQEYIDMSNLAVNYFKELRQVV